MLVKFLPSPEGAPPPTQLQFSPSAQTKFVICDCTIEPLFGDIKGHGFDLQTSRLRDPARLSRLMVAVSLAYLWLCFLGSLALMTGQAKWVDRTDRRDRSIFTIGRQWLNRLLKLDKAFLVGFCPYPFLKLSAPPGAD